MKTALFKITFSFFLINLIFALGFASEPANPLPEYDNAKLEKSCDEFIQSLDVLKITHDYPKVIQNLLSVDAEKQIHGLQTLSETEDLNAIPWIIPLLDSDNRYVKVHASLTLMKIVTSYTLQRRDKNYPDKIVIKPLGKNDKDLRPLAWIILKMLRDSDPNNQSYAATMIGYLNLTYLDDDLRLLLKSRQPTVVRSAQNALGMLKIEETVKQVSLIDYEYKVYSDTLLQLPEKDVLVIRKKTRLGRNMKSVEAYDSLKKSFGELINDDLIHEFVAINSKSAELQNKFGKNLNIILMSKESEDKIFKPIDGCWKRFYSEYPNASGIIELSRIAFNADKTKALLYYGSSFDSGKGGIGYYILLKKHENEWVIQRKVMCWIA